MNDYYIFLGWCTFPYSKATYFIPVNGYYKILQMTLGPTHFHRPPNNYKRKVEESREGTIRAEGDVTFLPSWPPHLQVK